MNKKDSLEFLQSCINSVANASEEDIEMFRMKYDMHCSEPLTSSELEFIPPIDIKCSNERLVLWRKFLEKEKNMVELKIDYNKLKSMTLEEANEIISKLDFKHFLEDVGGEVQDKEYYFNIVEEGDWDDEGKYQYKTDIGLLCMMENNGVDDMATTFDIAVLLDVTRSGSYFSEYYYNFDEPRVNKVIKKIIPKQIIPEREVITLEE